MTRLLLVAAVVVAVLAAGVVSGAGETWDVHPGDSIRGCDLRRRGGGYDLRACRGRMPGNVDVDILRTATN